MKISSLRLLIVPLLVTVLLAGSQMALAQPQFQSPYAQQERITDYDVELQVLRDGSVEATERITFDVMNHAINHGIVRDIPTTAPDQNGKARRVPFELLGIARDGNSEPYSLEWRGRVRSFKIGDGDVYLSPGLHTWEIRYRYERVLHHFPESTLLRWDVTGNEWTFPIERVRARVFLPEPVPAEQLQLGGYVGDYGSKSAYGFTSQPGTGQAYFETTQPLTYGQGLTLELTFPAGVVEPPSAAALRAQRLADLRSLFIGLGGLILLLAYYMIAWAGHGRDPHAEGIVPLFDPPDDLPPAAMRYLRRMSMDTTAMTATLVSMARKGYLTIEETGPGDYTLRRTEAGDELLAEEEQLLAHTLFHRSKVVVVERDNHERLGAAKSALASWLAGRFGHEYYRRNLGLIILGWVISIFVAVLMLVGNGFELMLLYPAQFLLFPLLLGVNVLFAALLPRYTVRARALLDLIEGFRVALSYKGKAHWPGGLMDREMFERFLPYAIALDVEQDFARGFEQAWEAAGQQPQRQAPYWYHSPWNDSFHYSQFSRSLGQNFNSSLGTASTAPSSSSSGGGGGFSGGGAGGGGGSGW